MDLIRRLLGSPDSRRYRLRVWLTLLATVAATSLAGYTVTQQSIDISFEKKRADRVTAALIQECEDARAKGYVCKTDLDRLGLPRGLKGDKGDRGDRGEPGKNAPPISDAQLQAAFRRYLTAHPLPTVSGKTGATGATGPAGPACPEGFHQKIVRAKDGNRWVTAVWCIR